MSEKTEQSFLNFTRKRQYGLLTSAQDWEGRRPWLYLLMMKSFRKAKGDGRVGDRHWKLYDYENKSSVFINW